MQHLDEGTIHAWIDGALSNEEASRVEQHVASCTECAAKVAEARGLVAASSRIVSALDSTPGGVLPAFGTRKARPWWSVGMSIGAAMAATLVIAVGYGVMRGPSESETVTIAAKDTARPTMNETPINAPAAAPVIAAKPTPVQVADRRAPDKASRGGVDSRQSVAAAAPMAASRTSSLSAIDVTSIDSVRPKVASAVVDSLQLERRQVAMRADSVRPTPAPAPPPIADGVQRAAISRAAMNAGAAGAVAGVQKQAAASTVTAFTPSSGRAARMTLVGCYEADRSTDVLPARFALRADSLGGNEVRYVDSTGKIDGRVADLDWVEIPGRAIIRATGRGPIMTIVRTAAAITAQSTLGPRTIRGVRCGQ